MHMRAARRNAAGLRTAHRANMEGKGSFNIVGEDLTQLTSIIRQV
jgi:hypothetical protein